VHQLTALWCIIKPQQYLSVLNPLPGLNRQFDDTTANLGGHADFLHRFQLTNGVEKAHKGLIADASHGHFDRRGDKGGGRRLLPVPKSPGDQSQ